MPKNKEFNNEHDYNDELHYESDTQVDEQSQEPWNSSFDEEDTSPGQEQSRAARKQTKQASSPFAKAILVIICVALLIPFIFYISVKSQKDTKLTKKQSDSIYVSSVKVEESSSEDKDDKKDDDKKDDEDESSSKDSTRPVRDESSQTTRPTRPAETPTAQQETPVAERPESQTPAPTGGSGSYTVNAGDTWYRIAVNHGVSVDALLAANGASEGTIIQPGQVITIP